MFPLKSGSWNSTTKLQPCVTLLSRKETETAKKLGILFTLLIESNFTTLLVDMTWNQDLWNKFQVN